MDRIERRNALRLFFANRPSSQGRQKSQGIFSADLIAFCKLLFLRLLHAHQTASGTLALRHKRSLGSHG